jgi:Histidine phosphatase superfamily (branch 1)
MTVRMSSSAAGADLQAALRRWENEGGAQAPEQVRQPGDLTAASLNVSANFSGWPRLYLIRHGETAWSITGQHTGRTDIALTSRGVEEARELQSFLCRIHFTEVLIALGKARRRRNCRQDSETFY